MSAPYPALRTAMGAFYFFYFVQIGMYIIFLPKLLTQHGFSATQVGIIYGAAPMMRFIFPFVFRRFFALDDRVFLVALFGMFGVSVLFGVSVDSFGPYLAMNLMYGATMGAVLPYVDTVALQVVSREHYGKVRLWGSIGFILIALWLGQALGSLEEALASLAIASLLTALAGTQIIRFDPHRHIPVDRDAERAFSLTKYWAFWVGAFLLQVSFGGFYNFFTIYESSYGFSQATISYLWSFGVLIEVAMLYFQGPFLRRNVLGVVQFATFSAVIRWGLLWLWPDVLIVSFVSQALHAFSFALYYTATIAYVYQLYTQKKLAQQFYLGITFGLGGSIGAILSGWIYDWKHSWLFLFSTLVALGALGMMELHAVRRRRNDAMG